MNERLFNLILGDDYNCHYIYRARAQNDTNPHHALPLEIFNYFNHGGKWWDTKPFPELKDFDDDPNLLLIVSYGDVLHMNFNHNISYEIKVIADYYKDYIDRIIFVTDYYGTAIHNPLNHNNNINMIDYSEFLFNTLAQSFLGRLNSDIVDLENKTFEFNFISMNRRDREWRRKAYMCIKDYSHGNISYQPLNKELKYNNYSYEEYDSLGSNIINFIKLVRNYNSAFFSIVTETTFRDPYVFITEKTIYAIASKTPFIIIGNPGSLAQLKKWGFKTYDMLFDESYDRIEDPDARLQAALDQDLIKNPRTPAELRKLYESVEDVIEYNFNHLSKLRLILVVELQDALARFKMTSNVPKRRRSNRDIDRDAGIINDMISTQITKKLLK